MRILGLHIIDILVIAVYLVGIVWIGQRLSGRQQDTEDFYLGGRRLGKFYQFFLNFGVTTDAGQAATVSREIYRQGIGGMWIQYLVIWLTPFYWFTSMLLRRVRLITVGDFFADRFDSKFLGGTYAAFMLMMAVIGGGSGYLVAGKMMQAVTAVPYEDLSIEQKKIVDDYHAYQDLGSRRAAGLTQAEEQRYDELSNRVKTKEIKAFFSYVDPLIFYVIYGVIVALYTMLGGFSAAAITDAIQGILIGVFSLMMIPFALGRVGGLAGLHAQVPDYKFQLFGSDVTSEYTLGMVAAMTLANLVSIIAVSHGMSVCGSARSETVARFGTILGTFFKRIIMIAWALIGLLALAMFSGKLHDPDLTWGVMTKELLSFAPGLIGMMLVGILAANMSTLDAGSVANSALFIKNLYEPLRPGRPERHYLNVGRLVIGGLLLGGIGAAYVGDDLMALFKYFIALPGIFGAVLWLGFVWRGLTRTAVIAEVFIGMTLFALIPNLFVMLPAVTHSKLFLEETEPHKIVIHTGALREDVSSGRARTVGEMMIKTKIIDPVPIYFDKIVTETPSNTAGGKPGPAVRSGRGRFNAEVWLLTLVGVGFRHASKAELETARFLVNALLPFLILVLVSLFTRPPPRPLLDRFFAKMHTPTRPDPAEDARALAAARADPGALESARLFPGTRWEFGKPTWIDALGFFGSWIVVGLIILLLWAVVTLY